MITKRIICNLSTLPSCDFKPPAYQGIPYEKVLEDRKRYMPQFYFMYYKQPLLIHHGYKQYLFDHRGNRYLDLISGISTVGIGHSHPEVSRVIKEQCDKLIHTSPIYMSQYQGQYSKMLCQQLGEGYDSVYLCNSGSQANDFAIQLSRLFTNNQKFLSLRNGYHGLVGNASAATNIGTWNSPTVRGIQFQKLSWPSTYRGAHNTTEGLIKDAKEVLSANTPGKVAGFLFECIQGAGGINSLPQGYLPQMCELVRKHHGLIICDQVQTGFGRVGKKFWGHKWQGIKPDIITMAKGIGNGVPLGAVVTRRQIAQAINFIFFNTYGGGHIQCRVGMEVLKALRKEKLHENAENVGQYLLAQLNKLKSKHQFIGDVRGKGLMIGIEIVKDQQTKEPGKQEANQLMNLTKDRQVLFGKGGAFGNVMRIQPPLCMSMEDAKYTVEIFDDALHHLK